MSDSTVESACTHPSWFLYGLDIEHRHFVFLQTCRTLLDAAAFHDGRTSLSNSNKQRVIPIESALEWYRNSGTQHTIKRLIVHASFCGSTLLARTLGRLDGVISYREPQALIQFVDWSVSGTHTAATLSQRQEIAGFLLGQYQKPWHESEVAFVKPSNWVNRSLMSLLDNVGPAKVVMLGLDLESYLVANVRGGKVRLSYSLDLLNAFAVNDDIRKKDIAEVQEDRIGSMSRVLRLLAICFHCQQEAMAQGGHAVGEDSLLKLSREDIVSDPLESLTRAARFLNLPGSSTSIAFAMASQYARNAKSDIAETWNTSVEASENHRITKNIQRDLNNTISWFSKRYA